jgi:HD-like signal output (HDOD) protein
MSTTLQNLLEEIRSLEPLPTVSLEVLELAGREDTQPVDLCRRIETDPALCARVLKFANSPLYGFVREIGSLEEACNLLGNRCLASLVMTSAVARCYMSAEEDAREWRRAAWERAIQNAIAARLLAGITGLADRHRAYTAALLCDIGRLVMLQHSPQALQAIETQTQDAEQQRQLEEQHFGIDHAGAGAFVLERWKLPDALVECARHHHQPAAAVIDPMLTRLVALASSIAEHFRTQQWGTQQPGSAFVSELSAELEGTGLDQVALAGMSECFAKDLERARALQSLA